MHHSSLNSWPVIDLHCDLLSYLAEVPGANPFKAEDIGAAFPHLQSGGVMLQVMALYTDVRPGSTQRTWKQAEQFSQLLQEYEAYLMGVQRQEQLQTLNKGNKVGIIAAIENAAGLCEEDGLLDKTFEQLEAIIKTAGPLLYIGMTHHTENRFGGGNYSEAGLKEDGKVLLDYLDGKGIAIDLSHTSDALARGIIDHIDQRNLKIPLLASHSNFRMVWQHARNLPDEYVQELIRRQGLIGINFLRAFVNNDEPSALLDHILYGMAKGAEDSLCFGADFFYTRDFPDKSRHPFYFPQHEHAGKYPQILESLEQRGFSTEQLRRLSYENAYRFISRLLPAE